MSDAVFLPDNFIETQEVEAKLAQGRDGRGQIPESMWDTYSSFANTHGGVIFLGVREISPSNFEGAGIIDIEKVETDLWNQLNNQGKVSDNLLQHQHVTRQQLSNGRYVLIIEVPQNGSKTEWVDRFTPDGTWSGNLYDFYRQVISRLFRDVKVPLKIDKDQREDETPLHKALRECLVNTLVHADYTERASILVVKAPDYYGFRNPGHMRISIEDALNGGKSDCRNRNLQKMFSLIGLGEQAGSGIPRILKNWNDLSFRQPELWESASPDSTLMRLRMTSLLPTESVDLMIATFGVTFQALDGDEKLALVTAHVEDYITNQRMQQVSRKHPSDITQLLQKLVNEGFLESHGAGRATTYTLKGAPNIDLADPFSSTLTTSAAKVTTSDPKVTTSTAKVTTSDPKVTTSLTEESEVWPLLMKMAKPIRCTERAKKEDIQACILQLCQEHFLTKDQLGLLLGREARSFRNKHLTPLYKEGKLEYRFPQIPNHEKQAYRATPICQRLHETS